MSKSRVVKGILGRWFFDRGPDLMEASCHHQAKGACGGCYARAIETLSLIERTENVSHAADLMVELKREKETTHA